MTTKKIQGYSIYHKELCAFNGLHDYVSCGTIVCDPDEFVRYVNSYCEEVLLDRPAPSYSVLPITKDFVTEELKEWRYVLQFGRDEAVIVVCHDVQVPLS